MLAEALADIHVPGHGRGRTRTRPNAVTADKAHSSATIRRQLCSRKITAVIPEKSDKIAAGTPRRPRWQAAETRHCAQGALYKDTPIGRHALDRAKAWRCTIAQTTTEVTGSARSCRFAAAPRSKVKSKKLRPLAQLIADVMTAGGRLEVVRKDDNGRKYGALVKSAIRYKKVLAGQILVVESGSRRGEAAIVLTGPPVYSA